MKKMVVVLLILLPWLAGAQTLDTLAAKESLDSLIRISASYLIKRDYMSMRTSADQIIALAERLHGRMSGQVAFGLSTLAMAAMNQGNMDLAVRSTEEALAIRYALFERTNPIIAMTLNNLGHMYSRVGRLAEAETCFLKFRAILVERLGTHHQDVGYALHHLANFYQNIGRYKDSEAYFLELKELWGNSYGRESAYYAMILNNLGLFVQSLGRFEEAEQYLLEAKRIREKVLKPDHADYAHSLNNLGCLYNNTGRNREAIPLLEQAIQILQDVGESNKVAYSTALSNLSGAYSGTGDKAKAEALLIEALVRADKAPDKEPIHQAAKLNNLAYLYQRTGRETKADSLFILAEEITAGNIGRHKLEYVIILINHATLCQAMGRYSDCDRLMLEARELEYDLLKQITQFLSEEELNRYIIQISNRIGQPFSVVIQRKTSSDLLSDLCFNGALIGKGFIQETVSAIRYHTYADTATARQFETLATLRRRLAQEYSRNPAERDTQLLRYAELRANLLEKGIFRTVGSNTETFRIIRSRDVRNSLAAGEAAVEFVSFAYHNQKGRPTDSTLYAALVLLPFDTAPHFIPLFEERQLQTMLHHPELGEELTVKGLYAPNSELLNLLWKPLEPLLRDVKTVYYSPAGLLHRINPAALRDADKQYLSEDRQWVRVGSTRELVTGRLADRSYALDTAASATAAVWGGIPYDMDSTAFAAANPLAPTAEPLPEFERKDGKFRYMVEDGAPVLPNRSGQRGGDGDRWGPLPGSEQEARQVDRMLQKAGFRTAVLSGYAASEERFKALGQEASSPRILHVATHGFAYPDPKKEPQRGFASDEPVYKIQDDPMLRSGLLLAGANHYWIAKRPLQNREDGVLVAYEVRDLNLRNTELAVLSACQTGLGDVVGSEGVYGLQRAFRIAGVKFLIVSLWQVPDEQTRELMRLFYENWVDKRESLRDAFNHAQATLREQEPNPYMWAGFVLIE